MRTKKRKYRLSLDLIDIYCSKLTDYIPKIESQILFGYIVTVEYQHYNSEDEKETHRYLIDFTIAYNFIVLCVKVNWKLNCGNVWFSRWWIHTKTRKQKLLNCIANYITMTFLFHLMINRCLKFPVHWNAIWSHVEINQREQYTIVDSTNHLILS